MRAECLLLELLEDGVGRSSENVMNFVHLVEFVVAGEEWEQSENFEVDAADTPVVHLVIVVAVSEEALGRSVPSGRDVLCEGRLGVDSATGPEVSQFDLIVFYQNVLSMKEK